MKPATQMIRDEAVNDMQAEAGAASVATRREEGIKRLAPVIGAHAATIVGEENFDTIFAGRQYLDLDAAFLAVGKRMRHRIKEQVGQYLPLGAGIADHGQIGLALDLQREVFLSQTWSQAQNDLIGQVAQIESALI
jgi:hypothetical protein